MGTTIAGNPYLIQAAEYITPGLPYFAAIGIDDEDRHIRERVQTACETVGYAWPEGRTTLALMPTNQPKRPGLVQRDWQTETGEKRSSFELNADDIGTSVRYATVQITKANESAATPPAPQSQPTQPAQPTQEAKDDPWPNVVQDHFAEPQEPSF